MPMPSEELMGYEEFKKTKFYSWIGDYLHAAYAMHFLDPKNEGLALSELEKMLKEEISMNTLQALVYKGMNSGEVKYKYEIIEGCIKPIYKLDSSFKEYLEEMLATISKRKKDPGITPASPA